MIGAEPSPSPPATHVRDETRFGFGENWRRFLALVDEQPERIATAEETLASRLRQVGIETLEGLTFLDVGSGSGLSSLAARRLGAAVTSFDVDDESVACTRQLRDGFFPDDDAWRVEKGSILDGTYVRALGQYDVVYSWGVLHHTGDMWQALDRAGSLVAPGGILWIAIYNDQGKTSARWARIKRAYNETPASLRWLILYPCFLRLWGPTIARDLLSGNPTRSWKKYSRTRGMSPWVDVVDWVGGYPYEVAKPEALFNFHVRRGFALESMDLRAVCSHGNNEMLFRRPPPS